MSKTKIENKVTAVVNAPADKFTDKAFCMDMKKRCNSIRKEMGKIESSFEKIAFDLYYIYTNKGYEVLGCKNIYELAKNEFGIARGTAHSFITIVDKFSKRDDSGVIVPQIEDKYKDFTSSQLSVMAAMDDTQIDSVTPDMSVRDIKKLSKTSTENKESDLASSVPADGESVQESKSDESCIKVQEQTVPTRQVLISFDSVEDYEKNIDNLDAIILCALKPKKKGEATKYKVEISMVW